MQNLNKTCFTICIVCIIGGLLLSLGMIWGESLPPAILWRVGLTLASFFFASALTLSVTRALTGQTRRKDLN